MSLLAQQAPPPGLHTVHPPGSSIPSSSEHGLSQGAHLGQPVVEPGPQAAQLSTGQLGVFSGREFFFKKSKMSKAETKIISGSAWSTAGAQ